MISTTHVRANVIDIRNRKIAVPLQLGVDANVLYWMFYQNFALLRSVGGRTPSPYQTTSYPAYWKRAAIAGSKFYSVNSILGEFAGIAEHAELESLWLADPSPPQRDLTRPVTQFEPRLRKLCRYHYSASLANVRRDIEGMLGLILKSVSLLPQFASQADHHNAGTKEWLPSCADFSDAVLVATAKNQGIFHILSDDVDLVTCQGITLCTANHNAIQAAKAAGKLV